MTSKQRLILFVSIFLLGILSYYMLSVKFLFLCKKYDPATLVHPSISPLKRVNLFYIKNGIWSSKSETILNGSINENLKSLIDKWLLYAFEEKLIEYRVATDFVFLDEEAQTLLISFDKNPISPNSSTRKKLYIFESLSRTLKEFDNIHFIQFLVSGEALNDDHLDFSVPWHSCGFI